MKRRMYYPPAVQAKVVAKPAALKRDSILSDVDYNSIVALAKSYDLPWLRMEGETISLIVDNHLLSTHRSCADAFMIQHVEGMHPKPGYGVPNLRRWYLDFGIVFHKMMQIYYTDFRKPKFDVIAWASNQSWIEWDKLNLDGIYSRHPEYIDIGGFKGFVGILLQYAKRWSAENEKLRIIGTEVSFGRDKDVSLYKALDLQIFLAGRMDVIVDDGFYIMPMDHKTTKSFYGDPSDRYIIDEGPTGYIFALKKVLPFFVSKDEILKRDCNRIQMNLIQKKVDTKDPMNRFRRVPIWKTEEQMRLYQQRMIASCYDLLVDLARYQRVEAVSRDTSHCTDWYHGKCAYFDVHRQSNTDGEQATLSNGFVKLPIWNTEEVSLNGI